MFMKNLFFALWSLTIAGMFIKQYSYRLVPFIMAENPDIKWKDAITLSRKMMNGNKWRTFVFDLSFWYWYLLKFITAGLVGVFFSIRILLLLKQNYMPRSVLKAMSVVSRTLNC